MLRIRRFASEYVVPADYRDAAEIKDRLDRVAGGGLVRSLAARVERSRAAEGEAVWTVRRLQLEFDVSAGMDAECVSERWAEAIARALERKLSEPDAPGEVVWFASEAELAARYVVAQASGGAARAWYFRRFEGLAMLQPSAAIRTVLEPEAGMRIAALLSDRDWLTVSAALTEADAARVLSAWRSGEMTSFETVWAAGGAGGFGAAGPGEESRGALRLAAAVLRRDAGLRPAAAAVAAMRLARLLEERRGQEEQWLDWLASGNVAQLYRELGASDAEALSGCLGASRGLLHEVARTVRQAARATRGTTFGGVFILLPLLAEMPFEALAEALGEEFPGVVRLLTAAKILGAQLVNDHVVREMLGVDKPIREGLAGYAAGVGQAHEVLDEWLRREEYVSGATRVDPAPSCRLRVKVDEARGMWMRFAAGAARDAPASPFLETTLAHLDFPAAFRARPRVNLFFSRVAQVLMRNLAWRLPGFHASSIPYLVANVLGMHATVARDGPVVQVTLGRPPLEVVLSVAGMMRREYRLPWLPDTIVSVGAEAV